jgi:major membrane immunogen (membrane-anchored lipoprotein)
MTFDGTTTFAEGSHEQVSVQSARKLDGEGATASRKHFLDAYAEHLQALKRSRSAK